MKLKLYQKISDILRDMNKEIEDKIYQLIVEKAINLETKKADDNSPA
jgi:hypothetical protein